MIIKDGYIIYKNIEEFNRIATKIKNFYINLQSISSIAFLNYSFLYPCQTLGFTTSEMNSVGSGKNEKQKAKKGSGYAFFYRTCTEDYKKKNPHESVIFADFSKKCTEKWKVFSLTLNFHNFSNFK